MISVLFCDPKGTYSHLPDLDLWGEARDARLYTGDNPVICHPPCERWGGYATVGGRALGDDGGCFAYALEACLQWGGIIEHPAGSRAWDVFCLPKPGRSGWSKVGSKGRSCLVEQGWYGHRAPKPTWIFAVLPHYPDLVWGPSPARGRVESMCHGEREKTPRQFAELLIGMVKISNQASAWPKAY